MRRECPNCSNDDQRLMEPRFFFAYAMWECLVCSKTWKEVTERRDDAVARPADHS
jgi:hypothetical protein